MTLFLILILLTLAPPDQLDNTLLQLLGSQDDQVWLIIPHNEDGRLQDEGGEVVLLTPRQVCHSGENLELQTVG